MTLTRMVRKGTIRRLNRGLYYKPRTHPWLGDLHPDVSAIIDAVSRRDGDVIHEFSESLAANLLGLTEQVPARVICMTTGRSRSIKVGNLVIRLCHRSPRKLKLSHVSIMVFAAFRNIGRIHLTTDRLARLRSSLSLVDRKCLLRDLPKAPGWMHPFLRHLCE